MLRNSRFTRLYPTPQCAAMRIVSTFAYATAADCVSRTLPAMHVGKATVKLCHSIRIFRPISCARLSPIRSDFVGVFGVLPGGDTVSFKMGEPCRCEEFVNASPIRVLSCERSRYTHDAAGVGSRGRKKLLTDPPDKDGGECHGDSMRRRCGRPLDE